ncbi:hypothetical protein BJY16_007830 [Actinoplanes octamycinicus]|uniref:Uncharacterized protein n=1 Tax=Actinoplanes octamycinicus TaxID=135948 RepID=A0A7W7H5I4_9ACTN|nr:hypothetical protein [Actinoplanes octamycinicus]MBB4744371.1 hypothetical protein [Actinoplanes octamycinicus]GIE56667.1 hypothetical protein Aoc01nite_20690 [Actinoplanes octamycinicus]
MQTTMWARGTVILAGSLILGLAAWGRPPFPYCGTLTMAALTAYAIRHATWTGPRRWTIAGLFLLTLSAALTDADPGGAGWPTATLAGDGLIALLNQWALAAGGLFLAGGLLLGAAQHPGPASERHDPQPRPPSEQPQPHVRLRRRKRLLIPAIAFAAAVLTTTWWLAGLGRPPGTATLTTLRLWALMPIALALILTALAALTGTRATRPATLGLLPLAGLLVGALGATAGNPALNERVHPVAIREIYEPSSTTLYLGTATTALPDYSPCSIHVACGYAVGGATGAAEFGAWSDPESGAWSDAEIGAWSDAEVGTSSDVEVAASRNAPATPWDPWNAEIDPHRAALAAWAALLLLGLIAMITTVPPARETTL